MNQFWRIAPHAQLIDDQKREQLFWDALNAAAIDKASCKTTPAPLAGRTPVEQWNDLDGKLEEVLTGDGFRRAVKNAAANGLFFPPPAPLAQLRSLTKK